jgi:N-carbamoylputrescine amidase
MSKINIGLVQMSCTASKEENLQKAVIKVNEAAKKGAQIICLQELFTSLYFCDEENYDNFKLAEPIPGPSTEALTKAAKENQVVIIASLFEKRTPGIYHNTTAVIDTDGKYLGKYRKMHIPDDPSYYEKFYFTPGDLGYKIFKTKFANIGVLICWDQWYPEAARITSLLGAQILFYPTAIGWHPDEKDEWGRAQVDAWRTAQRAHAIANGVYVASPNRIGHEDEAGTDGITFFGHSFICDPFGRYLAEAGEEPGVLLADCDPALIETVRRNWPFLRDRRIDAYSGIERRFLD